jgi:hypothetical protein
MNEAEEERTLTCDGHTLSDEVTCVKCGNPPRKRIPAWAKQGAIFAMSGTVYRVVTLACSTNARTPGNAHFTDYIYAEPLKSIPWRFPETPSTEDAIAAALSRLRELPCVFAHELEHATRLVPPEGEE